MSKHNRDRRRRRLNWHHSNPNAPEIVASFMVLPMAGHSIIKDYDGQIIVFQPAKLAEEFVERLIMTAEQEAMVEVTYGIDAAALRPSIVLMGQEKWDLFQKEQ